ncbi:MAG: exodeoxyribonuclease V subunit beta [Deltaproteobacteria bacterium]|nr:exodeoxyribonuclease V subunit beta [Deltaproteobacteria bacterium]
MMNAPFEDFDALKVLLQGRNIIDASAGTGKTHAITTLVVRLLIENRIDIRKILVVTFTEAATAELRSRIRARLHEALVTFRSLEENPTQGQGTMFEKEPELLTYARARKNIRVDRHRIERALADIDEAPISTIHGFCHRILHDAAFESGVLFETEMVSDLGPMRDEILCDYWSNVMASASDADIAILNDADILPSKLTQLADRSARDPDLRILPERVADNRLECFARMQSTWDHKAVEALLHSGTQITKQTVIKPSTFTGWVDEVEQYLKRVPSSDALALGVPKGVKKLEAGAILPAFKHAHPFFRAAEDFCDAHKAFTGRQNPVVLSYKKGLVEYVRAELPRRKAAGGVLSFDDLLHKLRHALSGPTGQRLAQVIHEQYQAALIDEFQDTDPIQFEIFSKIYSDASLPLFLIGDPKQAIYAFRGADILAYLNAVSAPGSKRYTMTMNYRSDRALVPAIGHLFAREGGPERPFLLEEINFQQVKPRDNASDRFVAGGPFLPEPIEILFCDVGTGGMTKDTVDRLLPRAIAADISALIRSGSEILDGDGKQAVKAGDIAVLTRTNKQCFAFQEALRALHIPAVVLGDESVFRSEQANQLQRILSAIVEPTNPQKLRNALVTTMLGVTGTQLVEMEEAPEQWDEWATLMRTWSDLWKERGFVQMFRSLLDVGGARARVLALADGERSMTNILHLGELLHAASRESHLGPPGLLHWLNQMCSETGPVSEGIEIRLESDEAAVKLTTIHKAKGLEYPVVYCPYLWDGWLLNSNDKFDVPFHDRDRSLAIDIGSADINQHRELAEEESLAENLRLAYVALTRAKQKMFVVWGKLPNVDTSGLGYLLHPPSGPVHVAALKDRGAAFDDAFLRKGIETLRRSGPAGKGIGLRTWDMSALANEGQLPLPGEAEATSLEARKVDRPIRAWWRTSSFSGLVANRSVLENDILQGRERDDGRPRDEGPSSASPSRFPDTPVALAKFPRGAHAGNFFHAVLEHLDFTDKDAISTVVDEQLRQHGFAVEEWSETVTQAVDHFLSLPIVAGDASFALDQVHPDKRLNEWEFFVPVASERTTRGKLSTLTCKGLAEVFRKHESAEIPARYASQLAELNFLPVEGFMKGFLDLLFEHDGRFYVCDYKSNHLGDTLNTYTPASMAVAMSHGHYYLQYHLYILAVHRHLQRTLPNYDYEKHMGGAVYLFLRGMGRVEAEGQPGVFFEKPPRARIEALSTLMQGSFAKDQP